MLKEEEKYPIGSTIIRGRHPLLEVSLYSTLTASQDPYLKIFEFTKKVAGDGLPACV